MTRFAVPLHDLDVLWRTPAGAALVEAALDDQDADGTEVVTIHGADAVVLRGPFPRVAALVSGFLAASRRATWAPTARVFGNDGRGWVRVTTPPTVPDLPDDEAAFEDAEAEGVLVHA